MMRSMCQAELVIVRPEIVRKWYGTHNVTNLQARTQATIYSFHETNWPFAARNCFSHYTFYDMIRVRRGLQQMYHYFTLICALSLSFTSGGPDLKSTSTNWSEFDPWLHKNRVKDLPKSRSFIITIEMDSTLYAMLPRVFNWRLASPFEAFKFYL